MTGWCRLAVIGVMLVTAAGTGAPEYDKALLDRRLNSTIEPCKRFNDESCALRWINRFGQVSDYFGNILNSFSFSYSNRLDKRVGGEMLQLSDRVQSWGLRHMKVARQFPWTNFTNKSLRRRFMFLTLDMTLVDDSERRELTLLQQSLMESYSKTSACTDAVGCLPAGEQAVSDAMANASLAYDTKAGVWRAWYDASAGALISNFTRYVELTNKAARARGFADAGEADWLTDFETRSFTTDVLDWNAQLSDLYRQLHAYVRHRLSLKHPGRFDPTGCLPCHILGKDQWGQQWHLPLEDFPFPAVSNTSIDYSELLNKRFQNFTEMVRAAEDFYVSIGMKPMTPEFWAKSDFLEPEDPKVVKDCHASAWEFASTTDFRIKMCGRIKKEDFYVIHHEMGHIEYFMAYSHLPREFRSGANSGFHEAVGDTMALSVDTRTHYSTLGLVDSSAESNEQEINSLFAMALNKIPFLPFSLTTGAFRWMVFNGTADSSNYNRVWWRLRAQLGGVCPPVDRPPVGFDAGAKYHVALDISYIRYYFSFILQFQLHRKMCELSGHSGPINRCDFYRSKAAGRKFWKMLQAGSSEPWQRILKEFSGADELQTSAILDYFKPLHNWLADYNERNRVPIGWAVPDNVLQGVSRGA